MHDLPHEVTTTSVRTTPIAHTVCPNLGFCVTRKRVHFFDAECPLYYSISACKYKEALTEKRYAYVSDIRTFLTTRPLPVENGANNREGKASTTRRPAPLTMMSHMHTHGCMGSIVCTF